MSEVSKTMDAYLYRASGFLDGAPLPELRPLNPDLGLNADQEKALMDKYHKDIHGRTTKYGIISSSLVGAGLFPLWQSFIADDTVVRSAGEQLLMAASFSGITAVLLYVLLGVAFMFFFTVRNEMFSPTVNPVRKAGKGNLMWKNPPEAAVIYTWAIQNSMASLQDKELDTNTALALQDVEYQTRLFLRKIKHAETPAEEASLIQELRNLAVETVALNYAWEDKILAEKDQFERALSEEGVNLSALIEQTIILNPNVESESILDSSKLNQQAVENS